MTLLHNFCPFCKTNKAQKIMTRLVLCEPNANIIRTVEFSWSYYPQIEVFIVFLV